MSFENLGADQLARLVAEMHTDVTKMWPADFCAKYRKLPRATTKSPGLFDPTLFPFWVEPLNHMDPRSDARQITCCKAVQVGFTVSFLENAVFYIIAQIKSAGLYFISADNKLAGQRWNNNIKPSLVASDLAHLIKSSDESNRKKTGETKELIQWEGGGFMIPAGSHNEAAMRSHSTQFLIGDETSGWRIQNSDGNALMLYFDRTSAYWDQRKIAIGSTPSQVPDVTHEEFLKGDQRYYNVRCFSCDHQQPLYMRQVETPNGKKGGFLWELTDAGSLVYESVRYACVHCGHEHVEADKVRLFSPDHGAEWIPTAEPSEPGHYSYHLPAWYSPYNFKSWAANIARMLEAYDPVTKTTHAIDKLQTVYNNVFGLPFEVQGQKILEHEARLNRRAWYGMKEVPNSKAQEYNRGKILFLTCTVDVHKWGLGVAVFGWADRNICYLIDYHRIVKKDTEVDARNNDSSVWPILYELVDHEVYKGDDGTDYEIFLTFVDASDGQSTLTVLDFCHACDLNVFPIMGRDKPSKNQQIKEFAKFDTQIGTTGFGITVDLYKDRLAPVLRRTWGVGEGQQKRFSFNAPRDTTDAMLKELAREYQKQKTDTRGRKTYYWHRPHGADQTLWDLLVYAYASVEVIAHYVVAEAMNQEKLSWEDFWWFCAEHPEVFKRSK